MAHALQDFIHPKDMVAPGVIGLMTMIITNALGKGFDLPHSWTALAVSGLFGFLIGIPLSAPILQRFVYFVLNSLIIFSMATGANVIGEPVAKGLAEASISAQSKLAGILGRTKELAQKPSDDGPSRKTEASRPFFEKWL